MQAPLSENASRGAGYRELAEKLTAMGLPETEGNIANKIGRGGFTAAFFVQCLDAMVPLMFGLVERMIANSVASVMLPSRSSAPMTLRYSSALLNLSS